MVLENAITELKNSLEEPDMNKHKKESAKLKKRPFDFIYSKEQKDKRWKNSDKSARKLWNIKKRTNICIMRVPEGGERKRQKANLKK